MVIVGGGLLFALRSGDISKGPVKAGIYDTFAKCISDSGATFYGAYWCSHCQAQKEAFGDSARYLPYVECSTPDGQGQTKVCEDKDVTGYPTWIFKDGTKLSGEVPMSVLAEKTSCALTPGVATSTPPAV